MDPNRRVGELILSSEIRTSVSLVREVRVCSPWEKKRAGCQLTCIYITTATRVTIEQLQTNFLLPEVIGFVFPRVNHECRQNSCFHFFFFNFFLRRLTCYDFYFCLGNSGAGGAACPIRPG
ncbi:hypothetical protein BDV37DRAFT_266878 [Aspergillus pseudonomiae]|uniref:Uncharacterized protein n=1 Tax=Aspergillus pseudonomiae TaxID=1506151 RepID=A0A5N7CS96_9EURO|nr:uncharacterized protein BDV37DRAFT_266878 [Aspergillus pseudonomiae]KAE8397015.1 hypothetical protein BDV37DRAFT_266878 [Aspergillus pseudonomiae]